MAQNTQRKETPISELITCGEAAKKYPQYGYTAQDYGHLARLKSVLSWRNLGSRRSYMIHEPSLLAFIEWRDKEVVPIVPIH